MCIWFVLIGRGRGRGFVEFIDGAAATAALALSGSILMQRPITVSPATHGRIIHTAPILVGTPIIDDLMRVCLALPYIFNRLRA